MSTASLSTLYALASLVATGSALWAVRRYLRAYLALPEDGRAAVRLRRLNALRAGLFVAGTIVLGVGGWALPRLIARLPGSDWPLAVPISQALLLLALTGATILVEWRMRRRDGVAAAQWHLTGRLILIELPPALAGVALGFGIPIAIRLALIAAGQPRWTVLAHAPATLLAVAAGVVAWAMLRPLLLRRVLGAYRPASAEAWEAAFARFGLPAPRLYEIPTAAGSDVRAGLWTLFSRHAGWRRPTAFVTAELVQALDPREGEALVLREVAHAFLRTTRRRIRRLLAAAETLALASLLYPAFEIPLSIAFGWDARTVQVWIPTLAVAVYAGLTIRRWLLLAHDEEKTADLFAVRSLGAEPAWLIGGLRKLVAETPGAARVLAARIEALEEGLEPAPRIPPYEENSEEGWHENRLRLAGISLGALAIALVIFLVTPFGKRAVLQTRLALAIRSHDANRLEALLKQGANPNRENLFGMSPVSAAAGSGDLQLLNSLLDNGGAVHHENWPNQPLHAAAAQGRKEAVGLLLIKGAPINAVDFFGRTPLWLAAANGHTETVVVLLEHGARTLTRDGSGLTAQQIAERRGYREIARAIRRAGRLARRTAATARN